MRRAASICLLLLSAGCSWRKPVQVNTAPPPVPAAKAAPPAPLVFPQNTRTVPSAQPVPAEAIPEPPVAGVATLTEPTPPPPHVATPAPRTSATSSAPPVLAPERPAPQRSTAALQSRTDAARDRAAIGGRLRDVRSLLNQIGRSLTGTGKDDLDRAAAMLDLAQKAFDAGNLRQAEDLVTRADMLARTIQNGR